MSLAPRVKLTLPPPARGLQPLGLQERPRRRRKLAACVAMLPRQKENFGMSCSESKWRNEAFAVNIRLAGIL